MGLRYGAPVSPSASGRRTSASPGPLPRGSGPFGHLRPLRERIAFGLTVAYAAAAREFLRPPRRGCASSGRSPPGPWRDPPEIVGLRGTNRSASGLSPSPLPRHQQPFRGGIRHRSPPASAGWRPGCGDAPVPPATDPPLRSGTGAPVSPSASGRRTSASPGPLPRGSGALRAPPTPSGEDRGRTDRRL